MDSRLQAGNRSKLLVSPGMFVMGMMGACRLGAGQFTRNPEEDHQRPASYLNLLAFDGGPVDAFEPRVIHDIAGAVAQVAEALRQVGRQESSDQVLRGRVNVTRDGKLAAEDLFVDLERVVGKEGRVAREQLEQEDAESPPVGGGAVTGRRDDLGSEVFGRAAEREGPVLDVFGLSGKATASQRLLSRLQTMMP